EVGEVISCLRTAEQYVTQCCSDWFGCVSAVAGRDLVVTQLAPAGPQLEEVYEIDTVHERLLRHHPSQTHGREVPPRFLVFVRAVGPHRTIHKVAVAEIVCDPGKVGYTVLSQPVVSGIIDINCPSLIEVPGLFVKVDKFASTGSQHFKRLVAERGSHHGSH